MTRAGDSYRFPWNKKAEEYALDLATLKHLPGGRMLDAISYRTIAAELYARGLVDRKPDAATVRRKVQQLRKEGRAAR
jgi:DNA-binding MarR family transcriptional regulator